MIKHIALLVGVSYIFLGLAALIGWVMNIVTLFNMTLTPLSGEAVLRIAGVFVAPLGALMGWV